MPAAAVIPAPVAYINVVAVKKLVVGFLADFPGPPNLVRVSTKVNRLSYQFFWASVQSDWFFYFEKLECLKQAYALNTLAWNNNIGLWSLFCWFLELK